MNELVGALGLGQAVTICYRHWGADIEPDVSFEAGCLQNQSINLVLAKSLGTLVATTAYSSFSFSPSRPVFIGTPLRSVAPDVLELYAKFTDNVPTLFIQQTADFTGSYMELNAITQEFARCDTVEVPGDDHSYSNIPALVAIIEPWAKAA